MTRKAPKGPLLVLKLEICKELNNVTHENFTASGD